MLNLLAQTYPVEPNSDVFTKIINFLIALAALATALKGIYNHSQSSKSIQNLASAVKDVATNPDGSPLPNVSPGTLPNINRIEEGQTGEKPESGI